MHNVIKIDEHSFWLGINDRRTHLFENLWPLENGVTYNSYIINDKKVALIDTVERSKVDDFLDKIHQVIGEKKKIDYLIINHMEPDHSGGIREIVQRYPDIKIVGNKMTFNLLRSFYGITENQLMIKHGDTLDLGQTKLEFFVTPWVHWPETMMTYNQTTKTLYTGDAFGSFGTLDGGIFDDELNLSFYEDEMLRYYSNIVGKYSKMVKKAMAKLADVDIKLIASTHGPIWRSNIAEVLDMYTKWSHQESDKGVVIVFGSMYGNTEKMADIIGRRLSEKGIKNIRIFDSSKTHISYILREIWRYKGLILGSSAYNAAAFPLMEVLVNKLEHIEVENKLLGTFGSSGWNKAGVKALNQFATQSGWEIVAESPEAKAAPDSAAIEKSLILADNMAARLHEIFE